MNALELARQFHETYERLAPQFGYETRKESAKPWEEVPEQNRNLMVAVCGEILAAPAPTIQEEDFNDVYEDYQDAVRRLNAAEKQLAEARADIESWEIARREAADMWDEAHAELTRLGAADTEPDASGRKVFLSLVTRIQEVAAQLSEIHNRFCGENSEPCQVCRLKAEREAK